MCIIAIVPALTAKKTGELTEEGMHFMWESNPDGAGLAYVSDNKVIINKGIFKLKEFTELYFDLRKKHRDSPFIVHFRYTTAGINSKENCHPFVCHDMAMFHNGTFYTMEKNNTKSDSFLMAEKLNTLPEGFITNNGYNFLFKQYIKKNRVCFLTKEKKTYVYNKTMWDVVDNIYYSNKFYKEKREVTPTYNTYNRNAYGYTQPNTVTETKCAKCGISLDHQAKYYVYKEDWDGNKPLCWYCKNQLSNSPPLLDKRKPDNCIYCLTPLTDDEMKNKTHLCNVCLENSYE